LATPGGAPLHWIIIDAEAIVHVDYTAARVLREVYQDLEQQGIELIFARAHPELQADLDRHNIVETCGRDRIFLRLHDALRAFNERYCTSPQADNR
jgi:MFS superfamily sulfate permease-like transporter